MGFSPLTVGLVVNEPQSPFVPAVHVADHITPLGGVVGSLLTVALTFASADRSRVDGGVSAVDVQLIDTEFAAVMATAAVAVATGVPTVVARMVTTPPALVGML